MIKTHKNIVLASKSPRRKELLKAIGLKFKTKPSNFEEKDTHLTPEELASHNALGKAQYIAHKYKNAIIIGVDTVVAYENHIIGKPKNKDHAREILETLSGTTHKVISAICIIDTSTNDMICALETTLVTMDKMKESDIKAYINSKEGRDKAAGYAIQGMGSLWIKKIEGDYFNVVGLPIHRLRKILEDFGAISI